MTQTKLAAAVERVRGAAEGKASVLFKDSRVNAVLGRAAKALLALVLARAEIFGGAAPFGICFVAAIEEPGDWIAALAGASLGYISLGATTGTLMLAAALLVMSAKLLQTHFRLRPSAWAMPLTALAAYLCAVFPYVALRGWVREDAAYFLCGTVLAGVCTYLYSLSRGEEETAEDGEQKREVRAVALMTGTLISLSSVTVLAGISIGRLLAALAVLAAAQAGGSGWGSCCGICAGLAIDAAMNRTPFFSMFYGASGMLSGVFFKRGKTFGTVAYVLAGGAAALWAWSSSLRIAVYYESFAASVLFMLIPSWDWTRTARLTPHKEDASFQTRRLLSYSQYRLEKTARAFRELYDAMSRAFVPSKTGTDAFCVFTRAADRVCKNCRRAHVCWGSESAATHSALNGCLSEIMKQGTVKKEFFPEYFAVGCSCFPAFAAETDRQLRLFLDERRLTSRQRENEKLLCRQYSELSHILSDCAQEFCWKVSFDPQAEKKLKKFLAGIGLQVKVTVFSGEYGRLHVEIDGENIGDKAPLETLRNEVGRLLERSFCQPEEIKGSFGRRVRLLEAEPMRVVAGAASGKKAGENISGDSVTYFKTAEGMLYVLLSDGMGSGQAAAQESRLTLSVLERFLRAGVSAEIALRTVDSALLIKNRESGTFSTLDLLRINLFTGQADMFKYGAAPSYIKRGRTVRKISGSSLPIGTGWKKGSPVQARFSLLAGDCVILSSDGLCDREDDDWIIQAIRDSDTDSPRELAAALLADGSLRSGSADDITACVLRMDNSS